MPTNMYMIDGNWAGRQVTRPWIIDANGASREVMEGFMIDGNGASRRFFPALPVISSISPSSNISTAGGATIYVYGSGFTNATTVIILGCVTLWPPSFTVDSDSQIHFTTPPLPAGQWQVFVTNRAGLSNDIIITTKVPIRYIVQNGVPQVAWSAAGVQFNGNAGGTLGSYGLSSVTGYGAADQVEVAALATTAPVDFSGFSTLTFVFTAWARDGSTNGYYKTGAGIYSNRTVGCGGRMDLWFQPDSLIAGWLCHQGWTGTYSLSVSGRAPAYIGLSSGGGYYGNGSILVSDIYLT